MPPWLSAFPRVSALNPTLARRTLSSLPPRPSLAIIDDYLNTSAPHFAHIPPSQLQVTTFTQKLTEDALVERLQPFELISTMRERTAFPGSLLRRLPNLKLLLATGTQFETFDLDTARALGIPVVAAPGLGRTDAPAAPLKSKGTDIRAGGAHPTTQHTWALILALARNVPFDDAALKSSPTAWQSRPATNLTGRTLGVVGLGRLGAAVARIAHLAWGMRVLCWSANLTQAKADAMAVQVGLAPDADGEKTFRAVSKDELFRLADVVSLHYVLSPRSRGLIGAHELQLMQPSALLVNASRSALVDGPALLQALEHGKIGGAALDVFDVEPLPADSAWRRTDYWGRAGRARLVTTPHMGYVDKGLMDAWYAETAENVERWLGGRDVLHRLA
ncbi:glycerate dehydrogenase [Mycena galericulata]|nr:glycerate dehydrogenase [Mycena galericulata]